VVVLRANQLLQADNVRLDTFSPATAQRFLSALNGSRECAPVLGVDEILRQRSQEAFLVHLRSLADQWIATGRTSGEYGEDPRKRALTTALKITLNKWAAGNKLDSRFDDAGEWIVSLPVVKISFAGEGVLITLIEAAVQEAVRLFAAFFDSPYRYLLCQCRSCNTYYFSQRQRKSLIKYGTYCRRQRRIASALRSYKAKRASAQERRLQVAAIWKNKFPKDIQGDWPKEAAWIASKVNDNMSPIGTPIGRNWVTVNRAEIERRSTALQAPPKSLKSGP